jgi:hypothetical protein
MACQEKCPGGSWPGALRHALERTTHRGGIALFYPVGGSMANAALPMQSLGFCVSFLSNFFISPRRQGGGRGPWDALDRHPFADPRRWRPAGGPVPGAAGADLSTFIC